MGQIAFNNQKPKYCKLRAIRPGGQHVNDDVALNEVWLVDTTEAPKSSTGTGEYDAYIIGDGVKKAGQLPLHYNTPRSLSELEGDSTHRTVTDEDITKWNSGTGGDGDVINNPDNEDLKSVEVLGTDVIKFNDKIYNPSSFSGYGKKYLRKNIVNETELQLDPIDIVRIPDTQITPAEGDTPATYAPANVNDAINTVNASETRIAGRIKHGYWNLRAGVGGQAVLFDRPSASDANTGPYWSVGYIITKVNEGESCNISADFISATSTGSNAGYFWAVIDNVDDKNILQCDDVIYNTVVSLSKNVNIEHTGWLVVNYIDYLNPPYSITLHEPTEVFKDFNILNSSTVNSSNTIYIIQYDYDLNFAELTLPENSVLMFLGGSIKNAYINGNSATILADDSKNIFGKNTTIKGTWTNREWYPTWFGAAANGVTDDTEVLQKLLDLSVILRKPVIIDLLNKTYRTTYSLYIKSDTTLRNGTIKAKFQNQMAWILKTYTYYSIAGKVFGDSAPGALLDWQTFDEGYIIATENSLIENIKLIGELNKHYTEVIENEGEENETRNLVEDGTYTPIYGGLAINGSGSLNTRNVSISGVGVGLGRGACLKTCDDGLNINAYFVGFAGYAVNGHSVRDSYINAYAKTESTSIVPSNYRPYITPFYPEYNTLVSRANTSYLRGSGGVDRVDGNPMRPRFSNVQLNYAYSIIFDNILMDIYGEIGIAMTTESIATFRNTWFEQIHDCLALVWTSDLVIESPLCSYNNRNEYDIMASNGNTTLVNCNGNYGIFCTGGTSGSTHKCSLAGTSKVFVVGDKTSNHPENSKFTYLSNPDTNGLQIVNITNSNTTTLSAGIGKYYNFTPAVNTLAVTLPTVTSAASVKAVILNLTTGSSPNITFTSTASISYFDSYQINSNNNYEISCLYNGSKWIIANASLS